MAKSSHQSREIGHVFLASASPKDSLHPFRTILNTRRDLCGFVLEAKVGTGEGMCCSREGLSKLNNGNSHWLCESKHGGGLRGECTVRVHPQWDGCGDDLSWNKLSSIVPEKHVHGQCRAKGGGAFNGNVCERHRGCAFITQSWTIFA